MPGEVEVGGIGALRTEADLAAWLESQLSPLRETAALSGAFLAALAPSTLLPPNPADGQEINYLADSANGVVWRLKYRAGSASAYKWEFLGGPPLWKVLGDEVLSATTGAWIDATTVPKVTVPLAGNYLARGLANWRLGTGGCSGFLGLAAGATAPSFQQAVNVATANNAGTVPVEGVLTGLAAAGDIRLRFYQNNASCFVNNKVLFVTPVRVG